MGGKLYERKDFHDHGDVNKGAYNDEILSSIMRSIGMFLENSQMNVSR